MHLLMLLRFLIAYERGTLLSDVTNLRFVQRTAISSVLPLLVSGLVDFLKEAVERLPALIPLLQTFHIHFVNLIKIPWIPWIIEAKPGILEKESSKNSHSTTEFTSDFQSTKKINPREASWSTARNPSSKVASAELKQRDEQTDNVCRPNYSCVSIQACLKLLSLLPTYCPAAEPDEVFGNMPELC
jgi:hypothetical protein